MPEDINVPSPLRKLNLEPYDRVRVIKGSSIYEGILMPKTEVLGDDYVVIKLDNGYNVGFKLSDIKVELLSKFYRSHVKPPQPSTLRANLPLISVIGTGGTIASRVEYKTGAVYPSLSAEDLYEAIPELSDVAVISTRTIFNIFSEDMRPEYWSTIAKAIAEELLKNDVQGVVVTHGTDTMGYTSAALSFALQQLPVPVVMVGAQRSSDRPSSDAALNMLGATLVAAHAPFAEVVVTMHESISDESLIVMRGTKVRKCHTSRRDAFKTINDKPIARVVKGKDIVMLTKDFKPRTVDRKSLRVYPSFDSRVALIKVYPGVPLEAIEWPLHAGFKGVVIEGTGLGHAPSYTFPSIKKLIDNGIVVVMTSQCLWGRVNMNVYRTGVELLRMGVIPCEDMLPETALVKLMWCLANAKDEDEVKSLMMTNIAGEISSRTEY
ncbi:MAG: Glu-tRNA(Gln) amidotransferase subunit GatD [Nitrososphaerota archaeon]|nr:Glu-tRNA(Gln) amidotransferase subunit GatD [Candidatus Nezhaarchaeota archaeon]MDW8050236.1 Glu-tRNA(Gln) amidotransferase subunit GatD [Nitrososphaerota archaeon]